MDEFEVGQCVDSWYDTPCKGAVVFTLCPFAEDIHGIQTSVWICEYHLKERCNDI